MVPPIPVLTCSDNRLEVYCSTRSTCFSQTSSCLKTFTETTAFKCLCCRRHFSFSFSFVLEIIFSTQWTCFVTNFHLLRFKATSDSCNAMSKFLSRKRRSKITDLIFRQKRFIPKLCWIVASREINLLELLFC